MSQGRKGEECGKTWKGSGPRESWYVKGLVVSLGHPVADQKGGQEKGAKKSQEGPREERFTRTEGKRRREPLPRNVGDQTGGRVSRLGIGYVLL